MRVLGIFRGKLLTLEKFQFQGLDFLCKSFLKKARGVMGFPVTFKGNGKYKVMVIDLPRDPRTVRCPEGAAQNGQEIARGALEA